jgi:hypothetical protein
VLRSDVSRTLWHLGFKRGWRLWWRFRQRPIARTRGHSSPLGRLHRAICPLLGGLRWRGCRQRSPYGGHWCVILGLGHWGSPQGGLAHHGAKATNATGSGTGIWRIGIGIWLITGRLRFNSDGIDHRSVELWHDDVCAGEGGQASRDVVILQVRRPENRVASSPRIWSHATWFGPG